MLKLDVYQINWLFKAHKTLNLTIAKCKAPCVFISTIAAKWESQGLIV